MSTVSTALPLEAQCTHRAPLRPESRRRMTLALEITLVLMIKLAALAMIWHVWFSDPEERRIDAERVGARMYSSSQAMR